jgi:hypothetical protein
LYPPYIILRITFLWNILNAFSSVTVPGRMQLACAEARKDKQATASEKFLFKFSRHCCHRAVEPSTGLSAECGTTEQDWTGAVLRRHGCAVYVLVVEERTLGLVSVILTEGQEAAGKGELTK